MKNCDSKLRNVYRVAGLAAVVFAVALYSYYGRGFTPELGGPEMDKFAKCLTDKGATMYGAYWCSHCMNQKKQFGASFQYVRYVECPDNIAVCLEKGVEGYPTWVFADGTKIIGETTLEKLAEASQCELPADL